MHMHYLPCVCITAAYWWAPQMKWLLLPNFGWLTTTL